MTTATSHDRARLGIGLAALGRPAYITTGRPSELGDGRGVEDLRARTFAVLDAAYAAGLRYVDAARSYGRAEEFLAAWLAAHAGADAGVGEVEIGSKWGYRYVGDWRMDAPVHEVKDHSLTAFRAQWAQTEALLGDRVAVYHVHSATPETGVLDDAELREQAIDAVFDAARFLSALYKQTGDWNLATANYHSANADRGEDYQRRVFGRVMTPMGAKGTPAAPASPYGVWPPPGSTYAALPPVEFSFGAFAPAPGRVLVQLPPLRR